MIYGKFFIDGNEVIQSAYDAIANNGDLNKYNLNEVMPNEVHLWLNSDANGVNENCEYSPVGNHTENGQTDAQTFERLRKWYESLSFQQKQEFNDLM